MVFGNQQRLQNDVFCLKEERDFFQEKFLEQISEIGALKSELQNYKREVLKLREEVMTASSVSGAHSCSLSGILAHNKNAKIQTEDKEDDASSLTCTEALTKHHLDADFEDDADEEDVRSSASNDSKIKDIQSIRKSAEKLLNWADYRTSVTASSMVSTTITVSSTPDHSSIASTSRQSTTDVPSTETSVEESPRSP